MIIQSKFQIRNLNINQVNKKTNWNKDTTAVSIWGIFKEFKAIKSNKIMCMMIKMCMSKTTISKLIIILIKRVWIRSGKILAK